MGVHNAIMMAAVGAAVAMTDVAILLLLSPVGVDRLAVTDKHLAELWLAVVTIVDQLQMTLTVTPLVVIDVVVNILKLKLVVHAVVVVVVPPAEVVGTVDNSKVVGQPKNGNMWRGD